MNPPIGIYGGTFDPIHYGHLRPCLELCESLKLDHVRFIPAFLPPHRDNPATEVVHRLEMVAKAIESEALFVLDEREIQRGGPSYMVDTLKSLRQDFPDNPLCLLMGMDAFSGIESWSHWQELLDYAHIIVTQRPDTDFHALDLWSDSLNQFYQKYKSQNNNTSSQNIHNSLHGLIQLESVTQLSISATDIRKRIKNSQSIRFLTPEPVIKLIECYNLYK